MRLGLIVILWVVNWLGIGFQPQSAQVDVQDVVADYTYGISVTFQARLTALEDVDQVYLMIQSEGENTRIEELKWNSEGKILYTYDLSLHPLRPFSHTYYWFRLITKSGEITTPSYWFDYIDNRVEWKTLSNEYFDIYWQKEDLTFGQKVMNTAKSSLDAAQKIIPVAPTLPLKIYVYPTAETMQSALLGISENWVAGHASPDLGVILLSISQGPDQALELERQLPHELMHILEYTLVGNQYSNTPVWLTEGTASVAELYPDADYQRVLDTASKNGELLSLANLCSAFPQDAGDAFLAYAQSTSFVRYIYRTYGSTGLTNLFRQYQTGLGCEEGVQAALGKSIRDIENDWRQNSFSVSPSNQAIKTLSPYLLLVLLVILVPLIMVLIFVRPKRQEKPS